MTLGDRLGRFHINSVLFIFYENIVNKICVKYT